jgi:hypothetical protein
VQWVDVEHLVCFPSFGQPACGLGPFVSLVLSSHSVASKLEKSVDTFTMEGKSHMSVKIL